MRPPTAQATMMCTTASFGRMAEGAGLLYHSDTARVGVASRPVPTHQRIFRKVLVPVEVSVCVFGAAVKCDHRWKQRSVPQAINNMAAQTSRHLHATPGMRCVNSSSSK